MKNVVKFLLVFILLISISCNEDSVTVSDDDMKIVEKAASHQTSDVFVVASLPEFEFVGSANLHRNKNGVTANFKTSDLEPGAYTLWIVVFNDPTACIEGCNEPDLFIEAVKGAVIFGTGHVVGNNGKGNFSARLNEGDNPVALFGLTSGLLDSQTAEIHLVLRTHGPAIPGIVNEQIDSYFGGCAPDNGTFACEDILAAVFPPN